MKIKLLILTLFQVCVAAFGQLSSAPTATPNPICEGQTLTLTANVSGGTAPYTYAWSGPAGFTSSVQNPTIATIALPDAGIYTLLTTDSLGATVTNSTTSVVVNAKIIPTFETLLLFYCRLVTPPVPPILPAAAVVPIPILPNTSSEGIDGAWSLNPVNDNPLALPLSVDTNPPPVGQLYVTRRYYFYPNASECGQNTFVDIVVTRNAVPAFSFPLTYCVGDIVPNLPLNSTNSVGGTWSTVTGAAVVKINTTTPGTFQYNFSPTPGLCALQVSFQVTIKPIITPTFNLPTFICASATAPILPTTSTNVPPIAGTWTPSIVSNVITKQYIFTPTPTLGVCASNLPVTITVRPLIASVTSFNYSSPVCKNAANPTPNASTGFTAGGTYSSTAGLVFISTATGQIDLGNSTIGTYTVTYAVAADIPNCLQGNSSTATITISPNTTPVTGFSYTSPICKNSPNLSPNLDPLFAIGGMYSATPIGLTFVSNTTGQIDLVNTAPNTYDITYSIPANLATCQLAGTRTVTIVVKPAIVPNGIFSYPTSVCQKETSTILAPTINLSTYTPGGVFTATPSGLILNSASGQIDLLSPPNTYTITNTITPNPTNCFTAPQVTTAIIEIRPLVIPVTAFNYVTPVCKSSTSNPFPIANIPLTAGGTFSATPSGLVFVSTATGQVNVSGSAVGVYTVTYSVPENSSICQAQRAGTATIEIKATRTPVSSFTYTSPVCQTNTFLTPNYGTGYTAGGTFTSTPLGLVFDPATGIIDLAASTPNTYTVSNLITADTTNCFTSNSTSTAQITITALRVPVTGFSYVSPKCQTTTATALNPSVVNGFTYDGTFSATPPGLIISSSTGVINLTSTPGTYTVTYRIIADGTNCFTADATATAQIIIDPLVFPIVGFTYTTPICQNTAATLSPNLATGFFNGGNFTSTPGLVFVTGSQGVIDMVASTFGTYTINYNIAGVPANCQEPGNSSFTIQIKKEVVPVGGFSYVPQVVCQTPTSSNQSPSLVNLFTTGGTFTSVPTGLIIDTLTGIIDKASAPNTYTVTYTTTPNATNCFTATIVTTATITINPFVNPITDFTYPTTSICKNALTNPIPTFVANHTTGGTFSSTTGLTLDPNSGVITLSSSTPGTYAVTYATLGVGPTTCLLAGNSTFTITISPILTPEVGFTYNSPICKNAVTASPSLTTGFVTGGIFSASPSLVINPSTGVIDVASNLTPTGTYTITYALPANDALCRLAGNSTFEISINTIIAPNSTFNYTTPICKNVGGSVLPGGPFTTGGVFSCSNTALIVNATTGAIDLLSPAGTYTVDYAIVATPINCFSSNSNSSAQITITPSTPSVTGFSYASPVCANASNPSPILNNGFTTGGTFSSTTGLVFVSTATGQIDLSSVPGTYLVTYTYLNNTIDCITDGTSTASITINAAITAVTGFNYNTSYCKNDPNPNPSSSGTITTGGTYSSTPAGLVFISTVTGQINLNDSATGTYTITYEVLNNTTTCQLPGSSTDIVTINPMVVPTTAFSYASVVCKDGGNQSPTFVNSTYTTGGTFTWTGGPLLSLNAVTGVIDPATSTAGTYTIKYETPANLATCLLLGSSTATIEIKDNILPVTTFSYNSPICKNSPNQSPILASGFAITGATFYSFTSGIVFDPSTGVIDTNSSDPGSYVILVRTPANNSTCLVEGGSFTNVTISPVETAITAFSYTSPICKKPGTTATLSAAPVTAGGTYIASAGLIINPTTGAIDLGSPAGVYLITYTVNLTAGPCLAGSSDFTFVITEPTVPTFAPIATSICKNELVVPLLPTLSTNGITGTWSPAQVTSDIVGSIVYTFTPASTFCATSPTITINTFAPTVEPTFTGISNYICNGVAAPILPTTSSNGFTGTWLPPTVNATANGTYVFTPTLGVCATQKTITINYIPEVVATIVDDCMNGNYSLMVNAVGSAFNAANTYQWKDELGTIIANNNLTTVNVSQHITYTTRVESLPITYSVKITTPEGCTSTQTFKIIDIFCEIQKGISPNNDGKNDFFDLTNFDVKQFEVFNRYGVKVYSKESYKKEWEGQTDGNIILPDGAYFYNIEFANNDLKTGWVYINKETK